MLKKVEKISLIGILFLSLLLGSWLLLHNDTVYGGDITRDLLLLDDVVTTKSPTLIGPHSGGVEGVFHGPAWLYLNLPAFLLGNGNPVFMGWYILFLSIISAGIVYFVAKKLFNADTALLAATLYSTYCIGFGHIMTNPFGGVILFPVFFYFLYTYLKQYKVLWLLAAFFTLGMIIQFQMAFGVPILILTTVYVAYKTYKAKKLFHMLSLLILVIPLSTFILFDLRHQFLQLNSVKMYLLVHHNGISLNDFLVNRIQGVFLGLYLLPRDPWIHTAVLALFAGLFMFEQREKAKNKKPPFFFYFLFFFLYFGYWIVTLLYRSVIWDYYYWPFLSMSVIVFASLIQYMKKYIFYTFFALMILSNLANGIKTNVINQPQFTGSDIASWQFYNKMASVPFTAKEKEFGYYISTPEQLGYDVRYAMFYLQKKYPDKKAYSYEKKQITYVFVAPELNSTKERDVTWWKIHQVKINKAPADVIHFKNGYRLEKYFLTLEETKPSSDPNLINSLHYR
jgi:hypothetical protein